MLRLATALANIVLWMPALLAGTPSFAISPFSLTHSTYPGRSVQQPLVSLIVTGSVRDSVNGRPLAGAIVQLVNDQGDASFGRTVKSDSIGRFEFDSVPDGRYLLGFFHTILDSLGVQPALRALVIDRQRRVYANLSTPSPTTIRTAICGKSVSENSGAVVMGTVIDARNNAPISDATVAGQWTELSIGIGGITRQFPRRVVRSQEGGWFALCNAPAPGTMTLRANRGADSTDAIEIQVPPGAIFIRTLYLGASRRVSVVNGDAVLAEAAAATGERHAAQDSSSNLSSNSRSIHVGDMKLSGKVVASIGGKPLFGAVVRIADGPRTTTNEKGEWTIANAPGGSRMLEVRAVGLYPEHRAVDVIDSAATITIAMATLKSVLDTVKVTAARLRTSNLVGFTERRRSQPGRFLTRDDISRRHAITTSELFRNIAGVHLDGYSFDSPILMSGVFAGRCAPAIYINGHYLSGIGVGEIDASVLPGELMGVEVYSPTSVPAQFQPALNGCGSIVMWTK